MFNALQIFKKWVKIEFPDQKFISLNLFKSEVYILKMIRRRQFQI